MTLPQPILKPLVAATAVFAAALLLFAALNRGPAPQPAGGVGTADASGTLALRGDDYLQKARETGDVSFYSRAERAYRAARRLDPQSSAAATGLGTLALARHDFAGALREGMRAHRLAPDVVRPLGVIADAQVELGRYEDAARTLDAMVGRKPNLASYSRVSYFRELHGDLGSALEAMRFAVSAGGPSPENVAYVRTLLGNLELQLGRLGAARASYREALSEVPGYPAAEAGVARIDAARRRFEPAIARLRGVVERLPLPEYVIALGETELAAGRAAAGRRDLELVRAEQRLLAGAGVNTDVEIALFEADHGSPRRAVALARRAWAGAPSVRSADALGWALTRAGDPGAGLRFARRALRLGSRDAMFLFHAGIAASAAGARAEARGHLRAALALNPRFSPLAAPRARRALEALR